MRVTKCHVGGGPPALPDLYKTYEELSGELEVVAAKVKLTVASARDLASMDENALTMVGAQKASSDPYVRVTCGSQYFETHVVHDSLYPSWEGTEKKSFCYTERDDERVLCP